MFAAAVVDLGMMLLSAVLSAEVRSAMTMIGIVGAIPVLAIATVSVIEGGVKQRVSRNVKRGGELRALAMRLRDSQV
jgi:hypothetical protein